MTSAVYSVTAYVIATATLGNVFGIVAELLFTCIKTLTATTPIPATNNPVVCYAHNLSPFSVLYFLLTQWHCELILSNLSKEKICKKGTVTISTKTSNILVGMLIMIYFIISEIVV